VRVNSGNWRPCLIRYIILVFFFFYHYFFLCKYHSHYFSFFFILLLCHYMFWFNVISFILLFYVWNDTLNCVIYQSQNQNLTFFRLVRYNVNLHSSLIKNKFAYIFIFSIFYIYILILGPIISLNNFYEIE